MTTSNHDNEHIPITRIAKTGQTDSLSGLSRIGYTIEWEPGSNRIFFRVASNSSSGKFCTDAVSLEEIGQCIADIPPNGTFKASAFNRLLPGKSINTPGFIAASILGEGLISRSKDEPRLYVRNDATEWLKGIQALIDCNVDLQSPTMGPSAVTKDDVPAKPAKSTKKSAAPAANA